MRDNDTKPVILIVDPEADASRHCRTTDCPVLA